MDATYKAIDQITGLQGRLLDYSVNSVTRGKDALGEVFVHVCFNDRNYTAKAASVDIIDASARAYVNAVNKALYEKKAGRNRTATGICVSGAAKDSTTRLPGPRSVQGA